MARLIHNLNGMPDSTPLGTYRQHDGASARIQASDVLATVRMGAQACRLDQHGYDLTRIGTHSLRSGGAMQLKLAGYDHDMIRKLGRWRSDTYLRYIQSQISELTLGVARSMAQLRWFTNVG